MATQRQLFINKLFQFLSAQKYVLLKHTYNSINEYPENSDLDFLVEKKNLDVIGNFVQSEENIVNIKKVSKSFAHNYFIYFSDASFLQIDLLTEFKIKNYQYLNAKAVLANRVQNNEGIYIPSFNHFVEHILLFNLLNGATVPNKYIFYLKLQNQNKLDVAFNYLQSKYQLLGKNLFQILLYKKQNHQAAYKAVMWLNGNLGASYFNNNVNYVLDTLKGFANNRGRTITFSGVDGAGKSTIIEQFKQTLQKKYRRQVVVLRHRPSLLPILSAYKYGKQKAESLAASKLPRQGKNQSKFKSFLRMSYYLFDYAVGQFYVFVKYNLRGIDVLYDRYYYDFMADPKRSNLVMDYKLTKWLSKIVFKPNLNFFLYASPDTILKRKQELKRDDILNLTANYSQVFDDFKLVYPNKEYCKIENEKLEETMQKICELYAKAA